MMFLLKVCWLRGLECLRGSTKGSVRCTVVIYGKIIAVRKDSNRLLKTQKTQNFPIFIVFILFFVKVSTDFEDCNLEKNQQRRKLAVRQSFMNR